MFIYCGFNDNLIFLGIKITNQQNPTQEYKRTKINIFSFTHIHTHIAHQLLLLFDKKKLRKWVKTN